MMAGLGIVEAIAHDLRQQMEIGNVCRVEYRHLLFDLIQNAAHICMVVLQLKDDFRHAALSVLRLASKSTPDRHPSP